MSASNDKFWELIEDVGTCMMVTHDQVDGLTARPMHAIPERESRSIWFYTELDSGKTAELEEDREVCLTFGCPRTNHFVSVSGTATVTQNRAKIKEHWSKFVDAWFPQGPEGEGVAMIRVSVKSGEYWDSQSSKVLAAMKMLIASNRDERPDLGENAKVSFG